MYLDDTRDVHLRIRAFSKPGTWYTRLGKIPARWVQAHTTRRYTKAVKDHVQEQRDE